jgi:hypothetical protein
MKKTFALCGGAVLACAGAASANTFVEVQELPFSGTPDFVETLNFQKAGELRSEALKSVTIEFELSISGGSFSVDNDGDEAGGVTVTYGANGFLSSDLLIPALAVNPANVGMFNLAADDEHPGGEPVFTGDGGPDEASLPGAMETQSNSTSTLLLSEFAGLGDFDIDVNANQSTNITGLGGIAFSGSLLAADGFVRITYEYVPTPGAAALLGLAGFAGLRRRRA